MLLKMSSFKYLSFILLSYAGSVAAVSYTETVPIPAGEFTMGCTDNETIVCQDTAQPVHQVHVDGFSIDKYLVTFERYNQCREAGQCTDLYQGGGCNAGLEWNTHHPVNCVNYQQASDFCTWEGKRLPTEAEWEKAARGTDGRLYPWGNEAPSCDYTVMNQKVEGNTIGPGCGAGTTQVVGSKPKGASPYGVMDMSGNLFEWTADWYDEKYYQYSPKNNPKGA